MCAGRRNIFVEQVDILYHTWQGETMTQETRQVNSGALLRAQALPSTCHMECGRVTGLATGT